MAKHVDLISDVGFHKARTSGRSHVSNGGVLTKKAVQMFCARP